VGPQAGRRDLMWETDKRQCRAIEEENMCEGAEREKASS